MKGKPQFVHGLELNKGFYFDAVKPLLEKAYPKLDYSASLIGYGSDVMGFDTEISMDHNWGPRGQIFVDDKSLIPEIKNYLSLELPFLYKGFSVNFTDPGYDKTQSMELAERKPLNHLIEVTSFEDYLASYLRTDRINNFTNTEWLRFSDQKLIEITAGKVFHDGLNKLNNTRKELSFYPMDVCKLRMAVLWFYISNKEAFIGRSGALDDIIGLKIMAGRIVNYLIKICFYLEGKYIAYSKWFGTSFKKLKSFNEIGPLVKDVLLENDPRLIEEKLCRLYSAVIKKHNETKGLPRLDNAIRNYFGRPYKVIFAENIIEALKNSIDDPEVKNTDIRKYGLDIVIDE
ncbi:hypothetical protein FACS189462_0180 [Spirochaetia bacterium]|nr:hypothetical protein FACS189462_0180 [Spirochaetia bacterium]